MPEAGDRCERFRSMVHADLDGELGGEDRALLETHIAGCRACAAWSGAMRRTVLAIEVLEAPGPAPGFAALVARRAVAERARVARRNRAHAAAAGALLVAASLAVIVVWGDVLEPLFVGIAAWAPGAILDSLGSIAAVAAATATFARLALPLVGAGAALAGQAATMLLPTYLTALAMVAIATVLSRVRKPPVATLRLISL